MRGGVVIDGDVWSAVLDEAHKTKKRTQVLQLT